MSSTDRTEPRVGVCYFPEHWPRERWATDAAQMAAAGLDVVRLAEFSWSTVEPERGAISFEWLDEAVETLAAEGLDVVLCTPTATPPKWLVDEHPEILQTERDGTVRGFGSRRHYCFNSEVYRRETARIVEAFASRYADTDAVIGWQTDNEYGVHDTIRCYCDDCAAAFRGWLAERYGDPATLNEAWGTTFWSQRYGSFAAVDPPRHTPAEHHPSLLLDYARFSHDSVASYNRLQTEVLRDANDDWFVTHNFMGDFGTLDAHDLGADLDFPAWDSYPTGFVQDRREGAATPAELRTGDPDEVSLNHDRYGAPFWVMEQQPGDVNWPPYAPQPAEGAMRLWAHQAVAHGGDAVLYFRWRRCRQGQEQYHAGLRRRDGSADRGYRDADRVADEFADLDLAPPDRSVALLDAFEHDWALSAQPHAPEFDYWTHARTYYRALRARGVGVDVVPPEDDLGGYEAVVAPTLYLADGTLADQLASFVEDGGHLLVTLRSGVKTPANQLREELPPGPLTDLVGATVARHESLPAHVETTVTYRGDGFEYRTFGEWLSPDAATVEGRHTAGVADGEPAIVSRDHGAGSVAYCGVWPETRLADALVTDLLDRAGVAYTDERLPETLRFAERDGLTWVLNFGLEQATVTAPRDATWTIGGPDVPAAGVSVVETAPAALSVEDD
ncbi:beta-galactosidase [Halobaculum sp. EA56]|uniref:beta-galactosidase n=1 Tax=Halobaculum sp. EA56 TaxID=3421648 RepID=UPI003EBE13E0